MDIFQTVYADSDVLWDVLHRHSGNGYVLGDPNKRYAAATTGNPMPLLHYWPLSCEEIRARARYTLVLDARNLIVASASFYEYRVGELLEGETLRHGVFGFGAICTHRDFRKHGFAALCLDEMFGWAQQAGAVLRFSADVEPDGESFVVPILPRIHATHPEVLVSYPFHPTLVDGGRDYKIVRPDVCEGARLAFG